MRRGNSVGLICLSVENALTFEITDLDSYLGMQIYLQNLQDKFVRQGQAKKCVCSALPSVL